jgi:stage V sporulation protein G
MADTNTNASVETGTGVKLDVRAYPISEPKGSTVAYASITINDMFAVNSIRVVNGEKGLFVAMPQAKDNRGEFRDLCFPVTGELRKQISDAVIGEYAATLDALLVQRESTTKKLRDAAKAAKERPVTPPLEKAAKKSEPAL